MARHRSNLEPRLAALEASHAALLRELQGVREDLREISKRLRPPWKTLASWAAVTLTVVGVIATPYVTSLQRHDEALDHLKERIILLEREPRP